MKIVSVEWGCFEARRPRNAGSNARLGDHGITIRAPIARLMTDEGVSGFGVCHANPDRAKEILGQSWEDLYHPSEGVRERWHAWEYPLWDMAGNRENRPVHALAAERNGRPASSALRVACYDTSLYFDDLHIPSTEEAALLMAEEARHGFDAGHRAFKIKVGRGARHMPLEEGTLRDIAVIRAVRGAVGANAPLLLDANNGYNLNLTKRVLSETADVGIVWMEEAFHEDPVLYRDLKAWLQQRELPVLIADGEGHADPHLLRWAAEGLVDVIQYDIFGHGFTRWLETGRLLDVDGVRSAPHHYGGHYGNFASCHLAGAIQGFTYAEWDEAHTPGIDTSAYVVADGFVSVPDAPGFGLRLDEEAFVHAVRTRGFSLRT